MSENESTVSANAVRSGVQLAGWEDQSALASMHFTGDPELVHRFATRARHRDGFSAQSPVRPGDTPVDRGREKDGTMNRMTTLRATFVLLAATALVMLVILAAG